MVDPSEPGPVEAALAACGRELAAIVVTHHHPDHVAGVPALAASRPGLPVYGFSKDASRIEGLTHGLHDGDVFVELGLSFRVLHVPGHTLGAIAYFVKQGDQSPAALFTGDTLFLSGCGRMFEGTPSMMRRSLVEVLAALPGDTEVFCGHEYTESNLRFAAAVEPASAAIAQAREKAAQRRAEGRPTVPSTLAEQRSINPFLRDDVATVRAFVGLGAEATPADVFGALRAAKDVFRLRRRGLKGLCSGRLVALAGDGALFHLEADGVRDERKFEPARVVKLWNQKQICHRQVFADAVSAEPSFVLRLTQQRLEGQEAAGNPETGPLALIFGVRGGLAHHREVLKGLGPRVDDLDELTHPRAGGRIGWADWGLGHEVVQELADGDRLG